MKTVIIGDIRDEFISDINTTLMLEGYPLKVLTATTFGKFAVSAASEKNAVAVLCDNMLDDADVSELNAPVYGYATTPTGNGALNDGGISSLGICRTSKELLDILAEDDIKPAYPAAKGTPESNDKRDTRPADDPPAKRPRSEDPRKAEARDGGIKRDAAQNPEQDDEQRTQNRRDVTTNEKLVDKDSLDRNNDKRNDIDMNDNRPDTREDTQTGSNAQPAPAGGAMPQFTPEMMQMMQMMMQQMGMTPNAANNANNSASSNPAADTSPAGGGHDDADDRAGDSDASDDPDSDDAARKSKRDKNAGGKMRNKKRKKDANTADNDIYADILDVEIANRHGTSIVTVYAAKGGVGKTSISNELAVCLAWRYMTLADTAFCGYNAP